MQLEGDDMGGGGLPRWVKPQLCKLVDEPPDGSEWLHEIKYDGYRMHARLDGGKTQLLTRTGLDWTHKYAPIADALSLLPVQQAYLDGELCGVRPDGKSSFSLIQAASDTGNAHALVFFIFDLLYLDGDAISSAPLLERKERLRGLLSNACSPLQYAITRLGAARSSMPGPVSCRWRGSSPSAQTQLTCRAIAVCGSRLSA
jgi:bifunctional non-homologous end joining protein LigD